MQSAAESLLFSSRPTKDNSPRWANWRGFSSALNSQFEPQPVKCGSSMLWRVSSRPVRSRSKPAGFIVPRQPAMADRAPSGFG